MRPGTGMVYRWRTDGVQIGVHSHLGWSWWLPGGSLQATGGLRWSGGLRRWSRFAANGPLPCGLDRFDGRERAWRRRREAGGLERMQKAEGRMQKERTSGAAPTCFRIPHSAFFLLVTAILGISAFYHDSAAALVVDGDIVAAAQEERFTRKKHDPGFPENAIAYCLSEARLKPEDLNCVAFYDKPLTKFDRLLETYLAYAPAGFRSFRLAMPLWLKDKLHMRRTLRQRFPVAAGARLVFTDHHESHAASAFFPSPFERAAILTLDGVGEWSTATLGEGEGNRLQLRQQLQFPHSLGLLYSAFTYYCGFKVNSGEYKLMGLAPYGRPVYEDVILKHLIALRPDGSFWMNMEYFNYCQGLTMTKRRFHELFGGPPRAPESLLEQRHMDLAASIQKVTEEIVLRMAREAHRQTKHEEPGAGGRCGAQLRRQWAAAARGTVREDLDSTGGGRRGRRAGGGPVRLAPTHEAPPPTQRPGQPKGQPAGAALFQRAYRARSRGDGRAARAARD